MYHLPTSRPPLREFNSRFRLAATFSRLAGTWPLRVLLDIRKVGEILSPLPNMFTAGTRNGLGRPLFCELLLAHWTGFGHHVCHSW